MDLVDYRKAKEARGEKWITAETATPQEAATAAKQLLNEMRRFAYRRAVDALNLPDFTKYTNAALSALLKHAPDAPMPYSFAYRELWEEADTTSANWREDAENDVEPLITFRQIMAFVKANKRKPGREFVPDADGKPNPANLIYTLGEVYAWKEARQRRKVKPVTVNCPECGEAFTPTRAGQKFDKRACADRAGHRRRYQSKQA